MTSAGWAVAAVRRHWLLSALLATGLVLRVLSLVAYRPAIIYVDTLKYLYNASPGADPRAPRSHSTFLCVGESGEARSPPTLAVR